MWHVYVMTVVLVLALAWRIYELWEFMPWLVVFSFLLYPLYALILGSMVSHEQSSKRD